MVPLWIELLIAGVVSLGVIAVVWAIVTGLLSLATRRTTPANNQALRQYHRTLKFLPGLNEFAFRGLEIASQVSGYVFTTWGGNPSNTTKNHYAPHKFS